MNIEKLKQQLEIINKTIKLLEEQKKTVINEINRISIKKGK